MARYTKSADGSYHIHGKKHMVLIGTRAQVWHGTAYKTSGGLKKTQLMQNKSGRIVSEKKHHSAKRENRLLKHGYGTKKGKFGWIKTGSKKHRSKKNRKSMRGGMSSSGNSHGSSANADHSDTTSSSTEPSVQQKMMMASKMQGSQDTNSNTNSNKF